MKKKKPRTPYFQGIRGFSADFISVTKNALNILVQYV